MRLLGAVDGTINRLDRPFVGGVEPYDRAWRGPRHYRGVLTDVWRPGLQDGVVWPGPNVPGRTPRSMAKQIITGFVDEDANATILAFCLTLDGMPLVKADIASLSYSVWDMRTGIAVSGFDWSVVSPIGIVFDTPQTKALDGRWNRDGGANFIHEVPSAAFPLGDRKYRYQCRVVETNGAWWFVLAELTSKSILRS